MSVKEQIYAELELLSSDALARILWAVREQAQAQPDARLQVLDGIDARSHAITPTVDVVDRVRDARSGAMFVEQH